MTNHARAHLGSKGGNPWLQGKGPRFIVANVLAASLLASAVPAARAGDFFFQDGDAVVMIGDSITEQHLYSSYVEMWSISRYPAWTLTFRNVGIGGDRSPGGNTRFARDVLGHKPTAMTVDFGMNDGGYRAFDEAGFNVYMNGLDGMARQAQGAKIRVAWITPSPVEKDEPGPALEGYNQTLEKYSAGVGEIAGRYGGLFVDQFHPFIEAQNRARAKAPGNRIGGGDAVHPGAPGQALMAWAILKGLHFPRLVSSVEIDAASARLVAAANCTVTALSATAGGVRFSREDDALPFFPEEARSILQWVPILEEMNDYGLRVTGLHAGRYEIRLGGRKIAEHSAAELATGVNLAAAALGDGPVAEQVRAVWNAVKAKNQYYHDRVFRGVVLMPVNIPDWIGDLSPSDIEARRQAALAERMAKLPDFDSAIRAALAMMAHAVEIVPVPD